MPFADKVLCANPALFAPFFDAPEIKLEGPDLGRIAKASGFSSPGETCRLVRGTDGKVASVQIAGGHLLTEAELQAEMTERYGAGAIS